MSLDVSKLTNIKKLSDGKITARCPACQAAGGDTKGEHLVVYKDGKYGCAANPEDRAHTKEIFRLVGHTKANIGHSEKITVRSVKIPESSVIMDLGKFSRFAKPVTIDPSPKPATRDEVREEESETDQSEQQAFVRSDVASSSVPAPIDEVSETDPGFDRAATEEEAMTFLERKVG